VKGKVRMKPLKRFHTSKLSPSGTEEDAGLRPVNIQSVGEYPHRHACSECGEPGHGPECWCGNPMRDEPCAQQEIPGERNLDCPSIDYAADTAAMRSFTFEEG